VKIAAKQKSNHYKYSCWSYGSNILLSKIMRISFSLLGTATSHTNADDVNNLSVEFNNIYSECNNSNVTNFLSIIYRLILEIVVERWKHRYKWRS
jgi:hypothetical protein